MLLNTLECTGQPPTPENYLALNISSAEFEKPHSKLDLIILCQVCFKHFVCCCIWHLVLMPVFGGRYFCHFRILQMQRPRLRVVKGLVRSHTASSSKARLEPWLTYLQGLALSRRGVLLSQLLCPAPQWGLSLFLGPCLGVPLCSSVLSVPPACPPSLSPLSVLTKAHISSVYSVPGTAEVFHVR